MSIADGIWESQPRRPSAAPCSLMEMRRRLGGGLVLSAETREEDVEADVVQIGVDTEIERSFGAGKTTGRGGVGGAVHDFVGGGRDVVIGGAGE